MRFLIGLLFLSLSQGLYASDPPSEWSGSAEGSFALTTGNTDTHSLGVAGEVDYKPPTWSALARLQYYQSFANGAENNNTLNTALRAGKTLAEHLDGFVQAAYFRNPYAGIVDRYSPEAGISYSILDGKPHLLKIEAAVGYLIENLAGSTHRDFVSGKVGAEYRWKFSPNAEIFDEIAYTRDFKSASDWRLSNSIGLAVAMTPLLSLKVSYGLQYVNQPAAGFKQTDGLTTAALVAKF